MSTLGLIANFITLAAIFVNFFLQSKVNAAQNGVNMSQRDINHIVHQRLLELEGRAPDPVKEEVRVH